MRFVAPAFAGMLLAGGAVAAPAMWEISDSDSRVRVLGSIHALPKDLDWRTELLDTALAEAPFVYFETDIGPRGMLAMTVKMFALSFTMAQDEPWTWRLTNEQTEILSDVLDKRGLTWTEVQYMPPWLLAAQLSMPGEEEESLAGFDFVNGVENVLQWELMPERKGYFETPGQQFDMLAGGTIDEQIAFLFLEIEQMGGDDSVLADLVRAWASGDQEAIAAMTVAGTPAEQEALDRLLVDRNRNWVPMIERMLADNHDNLIVVGAAHLAGENDVLDLMAEAGYTVTRIQ